MNLLRQIMIITRMNIAAIHNRLGASSVIVIGIAGVVGVLISVLALTTGLQHVMAGNARADRAVILSQGAIPTSSTIARADVQTLLDMPGIKIGADGKPLAAAMSIIPIELRTLIGNKRARVPIIGAGPQYFGSHPEFRLLEGRMFEPAVRELIIGKSALHRYTGAELGGKVSDSKGEWTIVGVYDANGDTSESYLMGDIDTVSSTYRRASVQTVNVMLKTPESLKELADGIAANPALKLDVKRESEFLGDISKGINRLLAIVAYGVGGMMAIGALFGALNTMYSAVGSRTLEIATLRAIGFGGAPLVLSILVESLLLALLGAAVGAGLAWLLFSGHSISSSLGVGVQIQAAMIVTGNLIATGVIWALIIGFLGGLFPAIRAARLPVAMALQVR